MGCGVIMLKKHWLFFQMNVIYLLFQPVYGFHISLKVDFLTFDCVPLVNDASVVSDNGQHAFSSGMLSFEFFLCGRGGVTIFK